MGDPSCPRCGSLEVEEMHDEVDIGVGVQHGPSSYLCLRCDHAWDYSVDLEGLR